MQRIFNILIFIILLTFEHQSSACTAFCLKTRNEIFLAKNLDWEIENGYVFLNERGLNKTILNTNHFKKADYSWQSKYRSITFNQFGKEFPLGGMNEKGLVIEELNMAPVKLIPDSAKQNINEFQLVQYLLDNCKSVDETIKELEKFQCKPLFQFLHYMIADKLGNVIIAEFNGYDFNIYFPEKTGFPVLSNNNYAESLKYLTKFQGFGGDLLISNRPGSNERFVSVCNLLTKYNNQPPVTYSFQILNTVKQEDTRWSLVYDIKNLSVNFKFHSCKMVKVFDFKDFLGLETISGLGANLTDCKLTGNNGLKTISTEENTQLIQNTLSLFYEKTKAETDTFLLNKITIHSNRNLKTMKNEQ